MKVWRKRRVGLLMVSAALIGVHYYLLDGLDGMVFALVAGNDTRYATGYSEAAFRTVKAGMSRERVLALLGEPLTKVPLDSAKESWRYSLSPTDSSYRIRSVLFRGCFVETVFHEFYVD